MSGPPPITIDPIIVEPSLLDNPAAITNPTAVVSVPAAPRPAYGVPLELTGYGTKITRIGGDAGTTTPIGGLWDKVARHRPNQFWNDDMSMCGPIYQTGQLPYNESPTGLILDGEPPYLPIIGSHFTTRNNPFIDVTLQFRWRPGYPEQGLSYHSAQKIFRVIKVVQQTPVNAFIFASDIEPSFGMWGDCVVSADGRFAVMCTRLKNPQKTGLVDFFCVMDLEGDPFRPSPVARAFTSVPMPIATKDAGMIDWCGISPTGKYVVIKYGINNPPSVARCFEINPTTLVGTPKVFSAADSPLRSVTVPATDPRDPDSSAARALKGWMMNHSRADIAIVNGSSVEALVGGIRDAATSNHCSNVEKAAQGKVVYQSLETGAHVHVSMGTAQLGGATEAEDHHTSARCYKTPGIILHTYAYHASNKFADEMVLWGMAAHGGTPGLIRCGTARTDNGNAAYFGAAHAVPSPGCEKIVFSSNWQRNANPVGPAGDYKSYILEPISVAVVQESDYVIEVQSPPEQVGDATVGDYEPPAENLRYFKK